MTPAELLEAVRIKARDLVEDLTALERALPTGSNVRGFVAVVHDRAAKVRDELRCIQVQL